MKALLAAVLVATMAAPGFAQQQPMLLAVPVSAGAVLPKNTQVVLSLNEALSTRSKRQKQGDTFDLTVARNVMFRGYVVIPRGARAIGHISWQTRKGAFGKSGKMELAFDYVLIGDMQIPITGRHREEGEGNGDAVTATFVFVSVLGSGLITGHSAEVPAGKEFVVWTSDDTPVNLPATMPAPAVGLVVQSPPVIAGALDAVAVPVKKAAAPPLPPKPFGNGKIRCTTCRN